MKTNILEITKQHGYFIKSPCDVSNARSRCTYFILDYRYVFKKKRSTRDINFMVGVSKTYYLPTKKKLGFTVFILYCDAANFITMSHCSCDTETTSQCMS